VNEAVGIVAARADEEGWHAPVINDIGAVAEDRSTRIEREIERR